MERNEGGASAPAPTVGMLPSPNHSWSFVMALLNEYNGGGNGSVFCSAGVCCSGPDVGVGCKEPDAGNGRELVDPMTVLSAGVAVERGGNGCVPVPGRPAAGWGVAGRGVAG